MSTSPSEGLWNSILAPEKPPGDVSYLSDCYNICFVQNIYSLYLFFPISKDFSRRQGVLLIKKETSLLNSFQLAKSTSSEEPKTGKLWKVPEKASSSPLPPGLTLHHGIFSASSSVFIIFFSTGPQALPEGL